MNTAVFILKSLWGKCIDIQCEKRSKIMVLKRMKIVVTKDNIQNSRNLAWGIAI